MKRPICQACNQRLCAINYYKDNVAHFRNRCGYCNSRNKKIKPPVARWQAAGYKKKSTCDRCGFKAIYSAQLLVYHMDGNLNNTELLNLKTVCLNCTVDLQKKDVTWRPGDLEPDR